MLSPSSEKCRHAGAPCFLRCVDLNEGFRVGRTPSRLRRESVELFGGKADVTRVVILVFDEVDLLDVGGPYEVFLTAERLARRLGLTDRFDVEVAGPSTDPVRAFGGLTIIPHVAAFDVTDVDIAVIPGAIAIDRVLEAEATKEQFSPSTIEAARHLTDLAETRSSVCTGAFLLGELGLLDGKSWTTHFEDVDGLAERIHSDGGMPWVRWVDSGDVVTSGGLSSGIAMALHLVDRYAGRDLAVATARQIEYDWDPEAGVVSA